MGTTVNSFINANMNELNDGMDEQSWQTKCSLFLINDLGLEWNEELNGLKNTD